MAKSARAVALPALIALFGAAIILILATVSRDPTPPDTMPQGTETNHRGSMRLPDGPVSVRSQYASQARIFLRGVATNQSVRVGCYNEDPTNYSVIGERDVSGANPLIMEVPPNIELTFSTFDTPAYPKLTVKQSFAAGAVEDVVFDWSSAAICTFELIGIERPEDHSLFLDWIDPDMPLAAWTRRVSRLDTDGRARIRGPLGRLVQPYLAIGNGISLVSETDDRRTFPLANTTYRVKLVNQGLSVRATMNGRAVAPIFGQTDQELVLGASGLLYMLPSQIGAGVRVLDLEGNHTYAQVGNLSKAVVNVVELSPPTASLFVEVAGEVPASLEVVLYGPVSGNVDPIHWDWRDPRARVRAVSSLDASKPCFSGLPPGRYLLMWQVGGERSSPFDRLELDDHSKRVVVTAPGFGSCSVRIEGLDPLLDFIGATDVIAKFNTCPKPRTVVRGKAVELCTWGGGLPALVRFVNPAMPVEVALTTALSTDGNEVMQVEDCDMLRLLASPVAGGRLELTVNDDVRPVMLSSDGTFHLCRRTGVSRIVRVWECWSDRRMFRGAYDIAGPVGHAELAANPVGRWVTVFNGSLNGLATLFAEDGNIETQVATAIAGHGTAVWLPSSVNHVRAQHDDNRIETIAIGTDSAMIEIGR
jgi:hypothetical protein